MSMPEEGWRVAEMKPERCLEMVMLGIVR